MNKNHMIIFDEFIRLLKDRFEEKLLTKEDSIRYTLFHSAITKGGFRPTEIILEQPHNKNPHWKVDMVTNTKTRKRGMVLEFKNHDTADYKLVGKVFRDIFRLRDFKFDEYNNFDRYFVYVTDDSAEKFLSNVDHEIDIFSLIHSLKTGPFFLDLDKLIDKREVDEYFDNTEESQGEKEFSSLNEYFKNELEREVKEACKYFCYVSLLKKETLSQNKVVRIFKIEDEDFEPEKN